jgi:hypothetical protein
VLAENYLAAADHLVQAEHMTDTNPICWGWFWRLQLDRSRTELHLAMGDRGEARRPADRVLDRASRVTRRPGKPWRGTNAAAVSLADSSTTRAEREVRSALRILDDRELRLACWRVQATAANIYAADGNNSQNAKLRAAFQEAVNPSIAQQCQHNRLV